MKRNLFISIGLLCLVACDKMDIPSSQADAFLKFYNTYTIFRGADIKEIPGKGYAVIGTVTTSLNGDQICLIRTDRYGNSLDSAAYYGGLNNEKAYALEVLDNKNMIILGSTVNSAGKTQPYLILTDSVGVVLKERIIASSENVEAVKFRVDSDGSIYMVGSGDYARVGSRLNRDIWLFAVHKDLQDYWDNPRYLGFSYEDKGTDLQLVYDDQDILRIFITGYSTSSSGAKHAFALKTGPLGFGGSLLQIDSIPNEGNCIQVIDANTFIIGGNSYENGLGSSDAMMEKITYTNAGISKVWTRKFGSGGNDVGNCIMLDGDKLHILCTMGSGSGPNSYISMITTDINGENPVYSNIGEGSHLTASTFSMTNDLGFIIAGTNERSTSDVSMAVIKLNAEGLLH